MEKRVLVSGKIKPGIYKGEKMPEIIEKIDNMKIRKSMKEILFLAAMSILSPEKRKEDIIKRLEFFKSKDGIYPEYSSSEYISKMIKEVNSLEKSEFEEFVNRTISYVKIKDISF